MRSIEALAGSTVQEAACDIHVEFQAAHAEARAEMMRSGLVTASPARAATGKVRWPKQSVRSQTLMPLPGVTVGPLRRLTHRGGHIGLSLCALSLWTGHARASKCYSYFYPTLVGHSEGARVEGDSTDTADSAAADSATSVGSPVWQAEAGLRLSQGVNRWSFTAIEGLGNDLTLLSPEPE